MKKISVYLVLITILSFMLIACENQENKEGQLESDQNLLVFSSLSSANVLNNKDVVSSLSEAQPIFNDSKTTYEIDMDEVNSYLLMMENILADGGPIVSSKKASDKEGYDWMLEINVKDLANNSSSYIIYYSILVDEVEELAHGGGKHRKAEEQFGGHKGSLDEEEIEYDINALAVIDGIEYDVVGKKEVEIEDGEEEVEIEFLIKLDETNYVKIEQEVEDDEEEYKYIIYKDGRKYSSMSFKTEVENGATVFKLTTSMDGVRETYKFIKNENKIIIKYSKDKYSYTLFVTSKLDEETNEVVYDYKVIEKDFNWQYRKDNKKD